MPLFHGPLDISQTFVWMDCRWIQRLGSWCWRWTWYFCLCASPGVYRMLHVSARRSVLAHAARSCLVARISVLMCSLVCLCCRFDSIAKPAAAPTASGITFTTTATHATIAGPLVLLMHTARTRLLPLTRTDAVHCQPLRGAPPCSMAAWAMISMKLKR